MADRRLGARWHALDRSERFLALLLPVFGVLAGLLVLGPILESPSLSWNDLRLAPPAALTRGYDLYYLPGDGPMLGHIYGPIAALTYLPVTLLPTPSLAIRAGVTLSFLLYLLPAALLLRTSGPRKTVSHGCVVLFVLFASWSDVVHEVAVRIHADTPAVAFAALACLPLVDTKRRSETRWLVASAVAAVLAAGSKQVVLPVLLALPAYVWLADGGRAMRRYASMIVLVGLGATILVATLTDVRAMLYQTLVVPSEHPWRFDDAFVVFVHTIRDIVPRSFLPLTIIAVWGGYRFSLSTGPDRFRRWACENPWLVPVFVGLFCVPTSMLGRMKTGGSMAALTYTIYFVVLGALLAVVQVAEVNPRFLRTTGRSAVTLALLAALTIVGVSAAPQVAGLPAIIQDLPRDAEASGYAFVRAHPGQVYVPYHPLLRLMAENRADHLLLPNLSQQYFEHVAADADLASTLADDEAFHAYVPTDLRYVLMRADGQTPLTALRIQRGVEAHLQRYLPEFTRSIEVAPGWFALVRDDDRVPGSTP